MCSTMHPTLTRVQRLDTRFRELQRRGNEIAGDSSRPEFRQVGMRGEKDCLSRSTGRQLRRPMKEIDASEYLRELETFHAEQDCFSIVNSNLPHLSDISCIDLYWASGTVCRAGQGDPQIQPQLRLCTCRDPRTTLHSSEVQALLELGLGSLAALGSKICEVRVLETLQEPCEQPEHAGEDRARNNKIRHRPSPTMQRAWDSLRPWSHRCRHEHAHGRPHEPTTSARFRFSMKLRDWNGNEM